MNEVIKHIRNVFIDKAINPEASFTKSMNRMSITSLKEKKSCYTDIETITKKQKVMNNNNEVINKKDEVINNNEKVMNMFDYKLIEGDGTCNGCCFDDGDKGCCFYDYVKDIGDDIIDNWSCGTSNIYIKVPKQPQLKYATNQGNVSATMDLLPPYDNLELEKVGITDNNQLTIYWKEKHEYLPDWNDLLNDKDINTYINSATQTVPMAVTDKHNKSMVAFAKISQLMPYYGGEADMSSSGYIVIYNKDNDSMTVYQISVALRKCIFPVFKTKESAQKFILKPDNVQLIKDLYMI